MEPVSNSQLYVQSQNRAIRLRLIDLHVQQNSIRVVGRPETWGPSGVCREPTRLSAGNVAHLIADVQRRRRLFLC